MTECVLCREDTQNQYNMIKAKYKETISQIKEEKIPVLGRNYRTGESPEVRKVGEIRYYMDKTNTLTGGLCDSCMAKKRKEDSWFRWTHLFSLGAAGLGMLLGGDVVLIQLISYFLLFMSLVGLLMRIARAVSHNDDIRIAEVLERYFLDKDLGGDGVTITKGEFLYRPQKNPERFVLFSEKEWFELKEDEQGTYLT